MPQKVDNQHKMEYICCVRDREGKEMRQIPVFSQHKAEEGEIREQKHWLTCRMGKKRNSKTVDKFVENF